MIVDGDPYRLATALVVLVGVVAGGWYLLLYQAWRASRWLRNPVARDASGWVVIVWSLYVWSLFRILINWGNGVRPDVTVGEAVIAVTLGLGLDGALIYRLRRYLTDLREERLHPTRICRCCKGSGVVLVGTTVEHLDEEAAADGGILEDGGQPE